MYDLSVIGAGWAGFTAALEARKKGLNVCLIEKDSVGGVCLHQGCIPTKALVHSAKIASLSKKSEKFGINSEIKAVDFKKIQKRKQELINRLKKGIEFQLKNRGIDLISGTASLKSSDCIAVGDQEIKTKIIIIATGSQSIELPQLQFDGKTILSSKDLLSIDLIPKNLLIVGGGVIGCEFASIFSTLGSKVTIVELLERILPTEDKEISKKIEVSFKKRGVAVMTKTNVDSVEKKSFDAILVCVGRKASIDSVNLANAGIKTERGSIVVDEFLRSNIPSIYAIGDCIGGFLLAHVAAYEGIVAANNIAGDNVKADYSTVPNCIFTEPEISSVGLSEDQARNKGYDTAVTKFNFLASGKAHILDETDGFIKLIFDKSTKKILGGSIVGPAATELISVLTLAVKTELTIAQIHDTIFAHPTLSEGIAEAAREVYPL
ncbi:dihydrolipoyl dehydrogenase [Candidatus Omnitrophota bacterium]